jgi:cytochrome P450
MTPEAYAARAHIRPNPNLAETPSLFSEQRLGLATAAILRPDSTTSTVRFRFAKRRDTQAPPEDTHAVFVARYADVVQVLTDEASFGVDHYREHIEEIAHGTNMVIGMSTASPARLDRLRILLAAMGGFNFIPLLEPFAKQATATLFARVLPAGRMDIVRDLALVVPVLTAKHFFGIPGPNRISPTAVAAMFARLEFTDIPPDWLARLPPLMEHEKPFVTIQQWAQAAFREVFLNIVRARELTISAQRMTSEMLLHIDQLMEEEYRRPSDEKHLLARLMKLKRNPAEFQLKAEDFRDPSALEKIDDHIRAILAELLVGGIYTVGKALANIVDLMLGPAERIDKIVIDGRERRDGLMAVLRECCTITDDAARTGKLDAFIAECLRFKPVSPVLFRICRTKTAINGVEVAPGDLVCAVVDGANLDPRKFRNFGEFRLDRDKTDYLHFGPIRGPHRCLGEPLAMAQLRGMLREIAQLGNLRRAAGPRGKLEELLRLPQSMVVRFTPRAQPRR